MGTNSRSLSTKKRETLQDAINAFSESFRRQLGLSGLTGQQIARKLEVSERRVDAWLHDESAPNLDFLIMLADIFDVSLDEMVGRKRPA